MQQQTPILPFPTSIGFFDADFSAADAGDEPGPGSFLEGPREGSLRSGNDADRQPKSRPCACHALTACRTCCANSWAYLVRQRVLVAQAARLLRCRVRVWPRGHPNGLPHVAVTAARVPHPLPNALLLRLCLCRRKVFHCHCATGEGDGTVVRPLRGAASRARGRLICPLGPRPPAA